VVGVARRERDLKELHDQLGTSCTPVVADVADPTLAARLIAGHRPRTIVLNAGAAPHCAPLPNQTWDSFCQNWEVDVRQVFHFLKEALTAPFDPGSVVVSPSSGAAMRRSPISVGYAGAKATVRFLSSYAAGEAERNSLGIRFVSILPQLTPATALGSVGVEAYVNCAGKSRDEFLAGFGATLTIDQVANSVLDVFTNDQCAAPAYVLNSGGLSALT
jgi:NADP-dependent 3-hydroxy acid dehydrogenase YdfG